MASQTADQEYRASLESVVLTWERRLRLQQAVAWLPRSVMPGLALGIILALVSRMRPWLLNQEIPAITLVGLVAGVATMLAAVWLWPRPQLRTARQLDLEFRLRERVSTALELAGGRIAANAELAERQLADARNSAQSVDYRDQIPLRFRGREWLASAMLLAALALLLLLPNPQSRAVQQSSAQNATIADAIEELKQLTEDLAADTSLTDEQREQLLETLQTSLETLQEENITPEEAFATLSETESELEEQSGFLNQQLQVQQEALGEATDSLDELGASRSSEEAGSEQGAAVSFLRSMNELREGLEQMTPAQLAEAADALEQAADAMERADPATAQALREAADALRRGDLEAAREALDQAAQNTTQSQQNQSTQSQTAQQLQQAAQQMNQSADQLAQGQQADQGMQSNQGQQPGAQGEQGAPGDQSQAFPQPGQVGDSGQVQIVEGEEGQDQDSAPMVSGGSGDAPAGPGTEVQSGLDSPGEIDQDNNPDGQGEGQFEPVFAPQRIGGESADQIILEPDQSQIPVAEGEFNPNPTGDVTVPYNEVFSDYRDAVNRALDTVYIPLGLRDVIHEYFTSLEPEQ